MTEGKKTAILSLVLYLNQCNCVFFLASGAWQEQESPAARRVLSDDKLFYYFTFVKLVISEMLTYLVSVISWGIFSVALEPGLYSDVSD